MRRTGAALLLAVFLLPGVLAAGTHLRTVGVATDGERPGAGDVLGLTGEGVVVAVLDTGVDNAHPSLAGAFLAGVDVSLAPLVFERDPADGDGHGTHVANLALGRGLADGRLRGVAPGARLVDVKVTSDVASLETDGLEAGLRWVLAYNERVPEPERVDVVSISLGSFRPGRDDDEASDLVRDLVGRGVVVVVAAGNCGPEGSATCTQTGADDTITSPGSSPLAVTVAATDERGTPHPSDDAVTSFSSRGPGGATAFGVRKPDVAAPGFDVLSAWPGGKEKRLNGTSQATPQVAGVVALLREARPDLDPAGVRRILNETARDRGVAGWDKETGWGLVDAYAAVRASRGGNAPPIAFATADPPGPVPPGTTVTFRAEGSRDPDGLRLRYRWDVDGHAGDGPVLAVRLDRPGNVTARVTVTDADGATSTAALVVRVEDDAPAPEEEPVVEDRDTTPPVARILVDPSAAVLGEEVTFDGLASTDDRGEGRPVGWSWRLTGADDFETTASIFGRAFSTPGVVRIHLTVVDAAGNVGAAEAALVVSPPPEADPDEDVLPPVVRIRAPAPGQRLLSPVEASWTVEDDVGVADVVVLLDGKATPAVGGRLAADLAAGSHVLRVEATDGAGNVGADQVVFVVVEPEVHVDPGEAPVPAGGWLVALAAALVAAARRR